MLIKNILIKKYENRKRMRAKKRIRHVWARYEHLTLYEILVWKLRPTLLGFFSRGG
jgi:hypothetical protein